MAKELKTQKGEFTFTGNLKEINKVMKDDGITLSRLELLIFDKDIESQVKLNIFPSSVGKYWDSQSKQIVEVNSKIDETMKEVRANNVGMPFGIDMKTPKGNKTYYVQDELINDLVKLQSGKFNVKVIGSIDFRMYNNRVQKNYNIKSIEILQGKINYSLLVKFPIAIAPINKSKFVYEEGVRKVNVLVKAKLENGQYGYRPIELGLDKSYFLNGRAVYIAKEKKLEVCSLINEKIMPLYNKAVKETQGYVLMSILGRLKVGEIVKKPSIDDLNPMEKILLEIQGEEAIKEKLDSMELVKEYFDSVILDSFDFEEGILKTQEISETELNLDTNSTSDLSQVASNPMAEILNGIMSETGSSNETVTEVVDVFGDEDKKEETDNQPTSDKLKEFVDRETVEEDNSQDTESQDEFPF